MMKSLVSFIGLSFLVSISMSAPVKHGREKIVVKRPENEGMQFKSFTPNETESMFTSVKGDQMNLTMSEANVSMQGYVSQEVKDQQVFHLYNNTNLYLTFRQKFLDQLTAKQLA